MIAFIAVEQQWEDSLIARQHIVNEVALYLVLMLATMFALPMPAGMLSPLGWALIFIVLALLVFNAVIIAYFAITHASLFSKRHKHRIQ